MWKSFLIVYSLGVARLIRQYFTCTKVASSVLGGDPMTIRRLAPCLPKYGGRESQHKRPRRGEFYLIYTTSER